MKQNPLPLGMGEFVNNTHHIKYEHMSLNTIQRAFRIIADRANLDKCLTIHCIRHYVASKLITSGVDLATVQSIGGWKSPSVLLSVRSEERRVGKECRSRWSPYH